MSWQRATVGLFAVASAAALAGCGSGGHKASAPPAPKAPVPLTSRYVCSRLSLSRLREITFDHWQKAVPVGKSLVGCDVSVSENAPARIYVRVVDERADPQLSSNGRQGMVEDWFQSQTVYGGHAVAGTNGRQWFRPTVSALVERDGLVVYSVQVLGGLQPPGPAMLSVDREVLALVRAS